MDEFNWRNSTRAAGKPWGYEVVPPGSEGWPACRGELRVWLTTLSTTLSVLTKSSWFRLQVDLLTSPAGVTNQRAHSCLAQSHVLTERMTFLTTYRVSALLTISSQYILYQIWQRCLMIRAELSVLTVSNHFDILKPNDSERKWKGQS